MAFLNTKMAIINVQLSEQDKQKLITLCEQDVRFVAAKSLTQVAKMAQDEIKRHIKNTFVLRKPNFEKSIKVRPATKQTLQASVYTMAGFAALQQTGGKKLPKDGRLAVPDYDDIRNVSLRRMTNRPETFVMKLRSGGQVLAHRRNKQIEILYHLKGVAYVPKRLEMLESGERTATTHISQVFKTNLQSAN